MLNAIDIFRLAGDRMRYLTQRQNVIARNIANADTPGYKAQDLAPFNANSALTNSGNLALVTTQPGHIAPPVAGFTTASASASNGYGEKPDGNTVSLEEQMVKSTDVGNNFALASAAYTASLSLMQTAIDAGK